MAVRVIGREVLGDAADGHRRQGHGRRARASATRGRVQGGALAGRIIDIGTTFAKVTLISDATSTVIGKLLTSRATGDVMGQAGGVLVMRNVDSAARSGHDEEVFTAGLVLDGGSARPIPRASSSAPSSTWSATPTPSSRRRSWSPRRTSTRSSTLLVITDYDGGLPPVDQQPVPCGEEGTVPEGEVPCYTPDPTAKASPRPSPKATPRP